MFNLKIGVKLFIAPFITIMLLIVLSIFSYSSLKTQKEFSAFSMHINNNIIHVNSAILSDSRLIHASLYKIFNLYTSKFKKEIIEEEIVKLKTVFDKTDKNISLLIKTLKKNKSPLVKDYLKIKNLFQDYHSTALESLDLVSFNAGIGFMLFAGADDIFMNMNKEIENFGKHANIKLSKFQEKSSQKIDSTITMLYIIVISSIFLSLFITILISNSIKQHLKEFQMGLLGFFKYLNREKSDVVYLNDKANDEIGDMAKVVNKNITKIKSGIEEDNILINNAKLTIDRINKGDYSKTISASTSNQSLEDFKDQVNYMITSTKKHFMDVNKILQQYACLDYRDSLSIEDIEKDGVFDLLVTDINKLRNAIVEMLQASSDSSNELFSKADFLQIQMDEFSDVSSAQVNALDEMALVIEQITESAYDTSSRTQEVVSQSNDIKSVVGIIEDIAEQTNLLALNAAIEAARAGEHGRGFAVVADEVRQLAEKTQKSLSEISVNVNVLSQSILGIGESIEKQSEDMTHIHAVISKIDQATQTNTTTLSKVNSVVVEVQEMSSHILEDVKRKKF